MKAEDILLNVNKGKKIIYSHYPELCLNSETILMKFLCSVQKIINNGRWFTLISIIYELTRYQVVGVQRERFERQSEILFTVLYK